ncbi:hypothetical protein Agub_g10520, partial [Astrephomene gubernaculifera]
MRGASLIGGGCLLKRAPRPAALAPFAWTASQRPSTSAQQRLLTFTHAAREDRACNAQQSLTVEQVLAELRRAHGTNELQPNVEAVVSGRGKHLGIAVTWSLRWTAGGSFLEEIRGPQMSFKWGYDGREGSGCWEVDSSGLVREMECDEHEAVLLAAYLRSGCWLQPGLLGRRLEV